MATREAFDYAGIQSLSPDLREAVILFRFGKRDDLDRAEALVRGHFGW